MNMYNTAQYRAPPPVWLGWTGLAGWHFMYIAWLTVASGGVDVVFELSLSLSQTGRERARGVEGVNVGAPM